LIAPYYRLKMSGKTSSVLKDWAKPLNPGKSVAEFIFI
jgi:hypothetical protein